MVHDVSNDITITNISFSFSLFFMAWSCTHDVVKVAARGVDLYIGCIF